MTMTDTRAFATLAARSRAPLCSVTALVVAAGLASTAQAQTAPPAPAISPQPLAAAPQAAPAPRPAETGVVNRILVNGNQRIDQTTVLSYLPIQPGDTVDPVVLDVALRTLQRTQLFADIQLGLQPNGDLVVSIVENPIINQIVFEGNSALSEKKLTEEVTLSPRGIYTRAKVQEDVGKIIELYPCRVGSPRPSRPSWCSWNRTGSI